MVLDKYPFEIFSGRESEDLRQIISKDGVLGIENMETTFERPKRFPPGSS